MSPAPGISPVGERAQQTGHPIHRRRILTDEERPAEAEATDHEPFVEVMRPALDCLEDRSVSLGETWWKFTLNERNEYTH
jgi:hypothetical protein